MTQPRLTPKQEQFAQMLLEYDSQSDAYRAAYDTAGMTAKQIHEEASKLANHPKVTPRVQALRERPDKAADVTRNRIIRELARIAFADAVDVAETIEPDGLDGLSEDQRSAITLAEMQESGEGKKLVVKLSDKVNALDKLCKMLGYYEPHNRQQQSAIAPIIPDFVMNPDSLRASGGESPAQTH